MELVALPAFADNYIWLLHDGRQAIVVDPGDAAPVAEALDSRDLVLAAILVTHHHADHVGGVDALRQRLQGHVWGPATEAIPSPFIPLKGGDTLSTLGLSFCVLDVPGHTAGHIAYFLAAANDTQLKAGSGFPEPLLFCGDTLFSAGCGRLFEGTPAQMLASLDRICALPNNTRVCCAHEYTLANLRFAHAVEPGNPDIVAYERTCQALRAASRPTLPSYLDLERRINPFLRVRNPAVIAATQAHDRDAAADAVSTFAALRRWKDTYR